MRIIKPKIKTFFEHLKNLLKTQMYDIHFVCFCICLVQVSHFSISVELREMQDVKIFYFHCIFRLSEVEVSEAEKEIECFVVLYNNDKLCNTSTIKVGTHLRLLCSNVNYLIDLIEILLKENTSDLFLKLVASVLPRHAVHTSPRRRRRHTWRSIQCDCLFRSVHYLLKVILIESTPLCIF